MTAQWSAAGGSRHVPDARGIIAGTTTTADDCGDARKRNRIKPSVLGGRGAGAGRTAPSPATSSSGNGRGGDDLAGGQAAPLSVRPTRARATGRTHARACPLARTRAFAAPTDPYSDDAFKTVSRELSLARVERVSAANSTEPSRSRFIIYAASARSCLVD